MEIKEAGKYRLLEKLTIRTPNSVSILPEGSEIEITQVSRQYKQIYGPELCDWQPNEINAEKVK